jgi:hypothetical protein
VWDDGFGRRKCFNQLVWNISLSIPISRQKIKTSPRALECGPTTEESNHLETTSKFELDRIFNKLFELPPLEKHLIASDVKMLCRTLRKSILDSSVGASALPPKFLLPSRARYFNTTTQHVNPPILNNEAPSSSSVAEETQSSQSASSIKTTNRSVPQQPTPPSQPLEITSSIRELLPYLKAQPSHYITIHIHGKPYLVTPGDSIRLPFHMPGVVPGDVLRLNRATALGSRDYTMKGAPYVDERLFECRAIVAGTEADPMRIKEKTKRRQRKVKTVKSKHKHTILRISELKIKSLEELEA